MDEFVFEKKKKRVRGRFLLWSGAFFVLGAVLIGSFYFVLNSSLFKVKGFEVGESRYTPRETLLAALNADMIGRSGFLSILGPDNILFWEFSDKPETLDNLPLVARVSVETNLTGGKIAVKAEERDFSGIWCLKSGDCYAFDDNGVIFARAPEAEGALILKVSDENDRPLILGNPFFVNSVWRENLFKTWEIMRDRGLVISRVVVKNLTLEEWEIKTAAGPVFQFNLNFMPSNLEKILDNLDEKFDFDKVTYFDFRIENRIYYK
ncbi:MAG: hypothetical protein V2A55_01885 [Candidatus Jorgensenbacteria bacterium]